jgi:hypothetical protein
VIGLLGFRRVGGLLGSPPVFPQPSGTWVRYVGTTVLASNTEVQCGFFSIPSGSAPVVAIPAIREEGTAIYSVQAETNAVPNLETLRYSLRKSGTTIDRFDLLARQRSSTVAARTVDWIVYVVTP